MDEVRISKLQHGGTVYLLRRALTANVECSDGLWVYHCPEINLWGTGEEQEQALRDLQENFAYLWREIVEEEDVLLDPKALELKRLLLHIADKQPAGV